MSKTVYFIFGSIGSGKSEVAKRLLCSNKFKDLIYIGSDAYKYKFFNQRNLEKKGYRCADELAFLVMKEACRNGKSFMYELCPTNHNKIESIKHLINEYNYKTIGFFVGTNNVNINLKRVIQRTNEGKDEVLEEKVKERYNDALGRVLELLSITNILYFIDNSKDNDNDNESMKVISRYKNNVFEIYDTNCDWFNRLKKQMNIK